MNNNKKVEVITNVRGIDIKTNTTYVITAADDLTSMSDDCKKTKNIHMDHGDTIGMPFYVTDFANNWGVYDTGFYTESPRYLGEPSNVVAEKVKRLNKYIREPYERYQGQNLDHQNFDFWDNYCISVRHNKLFNTEKLMDLMAVYTLASSSSVGAKFGKYYVGSRPIVYELSDAESMTTHEEDLANLQLESLGLFRELLKSDKTLLVNILRYSGLSSGIVKDTNDSTLTTSFMRWSESEANKKAFLNTYQLTQERNNGAELLETYSTCLKALETEVIVFKNNMFYYENNELGVTLKEAAEKLLQKNMEKVRLKLLNAI